MPPTDVAAAANARLVQTVQYDTDRRGWSMFARLAGAYQSAINGTEAGRVLPRNATFHGYAATPQTFVGMANHGGSRPTASTPAELGDARSTAFDDPSLRIFADRLRRRR